MKLITFLFLFSTLASASETKTECPWMKQMERRSNPKAGLEIVNLKTKLNYKKSAITSAQ